MQEVQGKCPTRTPHPPGTKRLLAVDSKEVLPTDRPSVSHYGMSMDVWEKKQKTNSQQRRVCFASETTPGEEQTRRWADNQLNSCNLRSGPPYA